MELTRFAVSPLNRYNSFLVYCRELAPGTVSLTGDLAQGDDSKHDSHYKLKTWMKFTNSFVLFVHFSLFEKTKGKKKCFIIKFYIPHSENVFTFQNANYYITILL